MASQIVSPFKGVLSNCLIKTQLCQVNQPYLTCIREASKKAGGSTRNKSNTPRPKHRKIRCQDGHWVTPGTLLIVQNKLRCLPGLNVGFGKNGTLFALETGRVMVTCEKMNANWEHTWVARYYAGRENMNIYKKYFHVIPEPQHCRFKLIDVE